jgi:N-acetylglucosaminyl-diphospho-decaprenol L-rhamnosyltransferase
MLPSVHIVIVNWNGGDELLKCVASISAVSSDKVRLSRITLVDNASTDHSLDSLIRRKRANLPVEIIKNLENRGFAAACNQGASGSRADYLLFLNPDARLNTGCLEIPASFLQDSANSSVGIVGVRLIGENGQVTRSCGRRPTPKQMIAQILGLDRVFPDLFPPLLMTEWPHDETREVDQVMGAFYFIRRDLFDTLGGFDERFFVYFEDLDLALRARSLGWTSMYLVTAQAFHRGCGTTDSAKAYRLFYFCRSRILFAFKHFNFFSALLIAASGLFLEPIARVVGLIVTGRVADALETAHGFAMLWADVLHFGRFRVGKFS